MQPINPFDLPSVKLSELNQLPKNTAIYFAIDAQNRILYIGQASNLAARWKNHHRTFQLQEIDKDSAVRIAWQTWNQEGLDEAEKYFIQTFHPSLNGSEVKAPKIIPSEFILRNFLKTMSRRLIIIGIQPQGEKDLPHVHLKYDWTNCSSRGTAAKIREFISNNKISNTSFKIRRKPYGRIYGMVFRPGSREQKANARENRSYNNHWYMACNGVMLHVTPCSHYKQLKEASHTRLLAGVKMKAVSNLHFENLSQIHTYYFSGLNCFEFDPVKLLWTK
ncbi:MAG: GIY-YIG nuclease family protein [Spirulinaceae cyanobacterium]